ncbi:flagellar hook-associated protein FlgK [Erythrobacter sp. THAF29]|uniref:flagellar hook-associated protein FlgK n=1 Tax=Erythrobacter sp. THAF29 TaxID=2587851 RepID=UPI001269042A|nr:flagellar hook-associated protein FlgK [Erythrobacter sp. THAF29]QFT76696.1 Flagellar hook-associated protein 1 [Erythrobacter sp. THAF29]
MSSAMIHIGLSGTRAARASLELTAQNVANASNPDYSRRTLSQSELVASAAIDFAARDAFAGVRVGDVRRISNELVQAQVRSSASDLARTEAEIEGLRVAETALEQSRLFGSLVAFEAALVRLESDPLDPTLRTAVLEGARRVADTFGLADGTLADARSLAGAEVTAGIDKVNGIATEIARINVGLAGVRDGSGTQAALLDARDAALRELSGELSISVRFDEFGAAEVSLAGAPPEVLVDKGSASALAVSSQPDGTVTFSIGGTNVEPVGGALAGRAAVLRDLAAAQTDLDALAADLIARANSAQASGAASDGSAGAPLFSGSAAADIALALQSPDGLATAPAGAPAGSRDTGNLRQFIASLGADDGPVAGTDRLLLGLSSKLAALDTRREGLSVIAQGAEAALLRETGVDLDTEAADLVRLQQAFEANSRVIQVATELFDTILGLR